MYDVHVKSILASNNMNLYRGCTHGCIYCDARSTCYQIHLDRDFEDIEVKVNAPELLEQVLRRKKKKCMITTGSMSDPYLQIEKQRELTKRCLELIEEYGFGVSIQTKSDLIVRDLDLLKRINKKTKCVVQMTLTTYEEELCKIVEPHVCTTKRRAEVLRIMKEEGIPTICWMTPILPFINDTEDNVRGILEYCKTAKCYGIFQFGMGVTLRDGDRQYFYKKLDQYFPGMKERYIKTYGNAYEVLSINNHKLTEIIKEECKRNNLVSKTEELFHYIHSFEDKEAGKQISLLLDN